MAKVQRLGDPEYSRLCNLLGKLATPGAEIDAADRAWLVDVLDAARLGEDVSKRFTKSAKPSPNAERHFWIACDVAQHLHDGKRPAHKLVAERWNIVTNSDDDDEIPALRKIISRQRKNTDSVQHLLGDGFARVIEAHRKRLAGTQVA
jgi:hypothetical protein